jgi:DNA modification methylase
MPKRRKVSAGGKQDALLFSAKSQNRLNEIMGGGEGEGFASGTSIFDPVLCELAYRWFCPPGGLVIDPFAGGSVRGIVASKLGRRYIGVDLSTNQITANQEQGQRICALDAQPLWLNGDSCNIEQMVGDVQADFIFSCPPFWSLEVYSDAPEDLSAMTYLQFLEAYNKIIAACVRLLKPDRFACFVVGDVRDEKGNYVNLPGKTVDAFEAAGATYYNEGVLVTSVGSLPVRITKQFNSGRKLGKSHQNVLIFIKGDSRKATAAIGDVV